MSSKRFSLFKAAKGWWSLVPKQKHFNFTFWKVRTENLSEIVDQREKKLVLKEFDKNNETANNISQNEVNT